MKKLISALLLLCMLLASVSACTGPTGGSSDDSGKANPGVSDSGTVDSGTPDSSSDVEDVLDARASIPDDLPDTKFNGRAFRIASDAAGAGYVVQAEDTEGSVTNAALVARNQAVSDRFDVKIESVAVGDASSIAISEAMAGTPSAEIVSLINYKSGGAIVNQAFHNWYETSVDFTKPWFCSLINDNCTINNKAFTVTGDFAVSALTYTIGMFFNQTVCDEWGISADSLYEMVDNNEWTMDRFTTLVNSIYRDMDGQGERDAEDMYGLGSNRSDTIDVWLAAFGQPVSGRDSNGFMTLELVNEKTVDILEKLNVLLHQSNGSFLQYENTWDERLYFSRDLLAFCPLSFNECFGSLSNMESQYGILPMPKYDENQQQYLTTLIDEVAMFGIIRSTAVSELDFISVIFSALNAESYKQVYPVYYDSALKGRYSQDPETAKMIDLLMNGRTFDIAFTFGVSHLERFPYCIRNLVADGSTNIQGEFEARREALTRALEDINKVYQ